MHWKLDPFKEELATIILGGFDDSFGVSIIGGPGAAPLPLEDADVEYCIDDEPDLGGDDPCDGKDWLAQELEQLLGETYGETYSASVEEVCASVDTHLDSDDGEDDFVPPPLDPTIGSHMPAGARREPTMQDSLEFRRAAALQATTNNLDELCTLFAIRVQSDSWSFYDSNTNLLLGRIRPIEMHVLQGCCMLYGHSNCKIILKSHLNFRDTEAAILKWMVAGLGRRSAQTHAIDAEGLLIHFNRV